MSEFFNKENVSFGRCQIEALNIPSGWEIFDGEKVELPISRIKTASMDKSETDLDGFDLKKALKEHPEHLFVKVFAIKKDEVNDNGDAFSAEELKKAVPSFIGCPLFCNHANNDIEKARGSVVHAWYDDDKGGIMIISRVDKVAYPKLARGIEEGYINGTSMGCQVQYSLCSICHNKAHVSEEYCDHVRNRKTKRFSGKHKCAYHKSKGKPDDNCPVCNCTKANAEEHDYKEAQIYEHNFGLKFIEDSFVVNPACHDCLVECVLNTDEYSKKAAEAVVRFNKAASTMGSQMRKVAGRIEIDYLNKAMKYFEVVSKSMIDQKDRVSMEYVSDLVDVMAKAQTVTDELMEMGYAQIPSPPTLEDPEALGDASPITDASGGSQVPPGQMPAPSQGAQPMIPQPNPEGGAGPASTPVGDIGSVTKPSTAKASGNLKDFYKQASNLRGKISSMYKTISQYHKPEASVDSSDYQLTKNNVTVVVHREGNGGFLVSAFNGENFVKMANIESFSSGLSQKFEETPDEVALQLIGLISHQLKESETNMANKQEKTAAGQGLTPESQQVTTEKQLANAKLDFHPRTGKSYEGVTESKEQLGLSTEPLKDVNSDSPQLRKDEYANVTTEAQLPDIGESPIARWNSYPEVITEKTWTEFTRAVGSVLSTDQADHTTQGQLQDLLSHHRWSEPNVTTEGQLGSNDNWATEDNAWLNKESANNYAKRLVTSAVNALADVIASYKRTPEEVVKAAKFITRDPQSQIKAAFLTLVNGLPMHRATRKAEVARAAYFKVATSTSATDALVACMGDNCVNLKAEDFVDAIRFVATDANKMAAVEARAQEKLAKSAEPVEDKIVDKFAAFEEAFGDLTNADGLYQVEASIEEIDADPADETAFIAAAERFAKAEVLAKYAKSDTVLVQLEIDDESNVAITTLKEASKLTANEKRDLAAKKSELSARAASRAELVKTAQGMGGEMGGGMGGTAPGQGATLPAPPADPAAAGAPPVESFENDPAAGGEEGLEGGDAEPMPPGSICPVCGSEDVDIIEGKGQCNNPKCGSQFVFKVNVEVVRWKGVTDNGDKEGEDDMEGEGEGFEMPEGGDAAGGLGDMGGMGAGGEAPGVPVAAETRLSPSSLKKLASNNIQIGQSSPLTGSTNTFALGKGSFLCLDTGTKYKVATAVDTKDVNAGLWVRYEWTPKYPGAGCPSCKRAKLAWSKALKTYGISDVEFDSLSFKKKADAILDMEKKGMFAVVKTASKNSSVLGDFKKAYSVDGKFPIENCREKIARRFGENGIALSGPCKGDNLADCVCNQLKKASIYSDGIAFKVAESWSDRDACLECMEDYVRLGYEMEKAASICNHMKVRYAQSGDLLAEELGNEHQHGGDPMGGGDDLGGTGPEMGGPDGGMDSPSPFDSDDNGGDPLGGDPMGGGNDPLGDTAPDLGGGAGQPEEIVDPSAMGGDPLGDATPDLGGAPTPDMGGASAGPGSTPGMVKIEVPIDTVLDGIKSQLGGGLGGGAPAGAPPALPGGAAVGVEESVELPGDELGGEEGGDFGGDDTDTDGDGDVGGDTDGDGDFDGGPDGGAALPDDDSSDDSSDDSGFGGGNEGDFGGGSEDNGIDKEPEVKDENPADRFAQYMRRGRQSRVGEINLDLKGVIAALKKQANEGKEPTVETSQDVVSDYSAGDGSTQGDEEKFSAEDPSVPRNNATIGEEPSDLNPNDKPLPKVPTGNQTMGGEAEQGYTTDGVPSMTGKAQASAKKSVKVANEKKVGPAKPVSEVTDVDFSANKDHPDSGKPRKPFEESDSKEIKNIPERGEGSFIGDEKTSLEFVPKADGANAPSIPTGGGKLSKEKNEKNNPEQQGAIKGTVIANNDEKSNAISRLASKMLKAQLIDDTELMKKVAELQSYQLTQLIDMEKMMDKANTKVAKGLATEPDGVEQTVPLVSEASNQPKQASPVNELRNKLSGLSTLHQRNNAAEATLADERKAFGR